MTPEEALPRLVAALGGRRSGAGYVCRCPLHGDRHPSLSVGLGSSGALLLFCHAGCDSRELIAEIRRRGLWPHLQAAPSRPNPAAALDAVNARRAKAAAIWRASVPIAMTPGEN